MSNPAATPDPAVTLVPLGGFGPRAAPLNSDYPISTLFLGLGQIGWHAASLVQSMMNVSLQPKDLGRVQYFAVARRPTVTPDGRLGRDSSLLLSLEETDWTHVPGRYSGAGVARWWPKPPRDRSITPDHTAIRCYGRLLLFENPKLVNDTLQQRVNSLIVASNRPGSDNRRLIVLLASIAEAEGSGLLFDLALLLRHQLADSPATIVAILTADVGPMSDAQRTLAMANVYATLKELDATMINPAHYRLGLPITVGSGKLSTGTFQINAEAQRPVDYLLITGETSRPTDATTPAASIAEIAATWVLSYAGSSGPDLQPLPPLSTQTERFDGYTTCNVSKIALPTSTAIDLIGSNLAQQLLTGMLSMYDDSSVEAWSQSTLAAFKGALLYDGPYEEHKPGERLKDLLSKTTPDALMNEFKKKKDDQEFGMRNLAEAIIRRLENEDRAVEMIDEGHTAHRLETLRTRVEDAMEGLQRKLETQITIFPTQLACLQGHGLRWTLTALDHLSRLTKETLNICREETTKAENAWMDARRRALNTAADHDERYSGIKRLLRGSNAKDVTEVAQTFVGVTQSLAEKIRWSTNTLIWQQSWEQVDAVRADVQAMLAQAERTRQAIIDQASASRRAMDVAAVSPAQFPAGVLVDADWFRVGVASVVSPNSPPEQLIPRVFRQWSHNIPQADRRVEKFVRDTLNASRQFLIGKFQFDSLQRYVMDRRDTQIVRKAFTDMPKAAVPQWVPPRDATGWKAHEWLRAVPDAVSLLPTGENYPWHRQIVSSPDADEIQLVRLVHRVTAEQIPALRGAYRRAYERTAAEGIPMHIDRRWDATLADLVRNSAQSEVSQLWEAALQASAHGPAAMQNPLNALIKMLSVALGVDPVAIQKIPTNANDFALTVYPLPTFRLRLPPAQCPIVYCFSDRRPRELGQDIYQAVMGLGLSEPFLFVVNVNNRRDMDVVVETLADESLNVVVLDEAQFKRVVGSRKPLSMLSEIVLTEVDLTLVSPFYTKAPVPERMFYGREREIKDVRRKIKTHSVALIGGRRIGKTSTLQQIERLLSVPDSGYVAYYLDCHNQMQYSHFFNSIARRWHIKAPTPDPTCFEDVVTEIAIRHPEQHIVFLFDEVDRLLTMDMQQQQSELLFRTFRSLSNEGKCHFIFSGERWLARAMENSYSALFNFALPVRLAPLEKSVVGRLVAEPFEMMNIWLEDATPMINRIYEISAGHPNIVQTICQEMVVSVDADKGNVGLLNQEHLDHALQQHALQEDIVRTIWGQMSDLARLITLLWPEDERRLTLDQIATKIRSVGLVNMQVRDLQEALKDLDLYCFCAPKGREFELIPVEFPHLLDYMTVKQMEITATIEVIQEKQKKAMFNR